MTIIGPNTGLGNSSMILMIESQLNYMVDYLRQLNVLGGRVALDARTSAVGSWNRRVQERMKRTVWNTGGCNSWYLDASGRNTTVWPGTTAEFRKATRSVDLSEYEVVRIPKRPPPRRGPGRPSPRRSWDEPAAAARQRPAGPRARTHRALGRRRPHPRRGARAGRRGRPWCSRTAGRAAPASGTRRSGTSRRTTGSSSTTSAATAARPRSPQGMQHRRPRRRP